MDYYAYCGVFNIDTVRTDLFLEHINDLEVSDTYACNYYIFGFNKEKIYTVAESYFD